MGNLPVQAKHIGLRVFVQFLDSVFLNAYLSDQQKVNILVKFDGKSEGGAKKCVNDFNQLIKDNFNGIINILLYVVKHSKKIDHHTVKQAKATLSKLLVTE